VVTKVDWMNPHSYFFMDVTDSKGAVANWKFEGFRPTSSTGTGWKRDVTLRPGDMITVLRMAGPRRYELGPLARSDLQRRQKTLLRTAAGTGDGGNVSPVAQ